MLGSGLATLRNDDEPQRSRNARSHRVAGHWGLNLVRNLGEPLFLANALPARSRTNLPATQVGDDLRRVAVLA